MSGVEIAGLVLGSFPIMLNCLDYYRQGFEPLEEWWNFREHFVAFVDDIRHQMMRYNENMVRLLDPIVVKSDSLAALVRNANDPRWTDGSLTHPLEQRLASEHGRFLRIIQRMEEEIRDLKKLLGIRDGNVRTGHGFQRSEPNCFIKLTFFEGTLDWIRTAAALGLAYEASADQLFEKQI